MNKFILSGLSTLLFSVAATAATVTVTVSDNAGSQLSDTVVYLQSANAVPVKPSNDLQIQQKGKEFSPFVSVAPVNSSLTFPNRDGIGHHVYSFSPAKTFELPLSEQELTTSILFDTPGIVTVGCNIHDWMVGYIYIVNTPYYAVTDQQGKLSINNVPAGSYTLHLWHPGIKSGKDLEQPMTINDQQDQQLNLKIDIKPQYFWKPTHPAENEEVQY